MLVLAYFVNDSVHDFAAAGRASPAYAAREAIANSAITLEILTYDSISAELLRDL